jgi:CubicO group peptidase (beta-lactamase class C family)
MLKKNLVIICCLATIVAQAQPSYHPAFFKDSLQRIEKIKATHAVVDNMYKQFVEENNFPGFVYGVVVDGQLLYWGQVGYTDVGKKIPATRSSVFRIASMTKSFTAVAVMRLRDQGKLSLDDPASKYIPGMKNTKQLTSDAPVITIRHLMTHMAGFPEDNPWGDRQLADTEAELLNLVGKGPSVSNVPGIAYEYSNLGFALLGQIVTKVSGQPYQQYIHETILKPLGMYNTFWDYKKVPAANLAHGYRRENDTWKEETLLDDGSYGAMGGLMTSLEDFAKYMALHMEAWPPRSGKESPVLKRSSLREMQITGSTVRLNPHNRLPGGRACATASLYAFGLGWIQDCDDRVWIGHSGGLPGFGSNWRFNPDYGVGIVCMANLTYAPTYNINTAVMDTLMKMADLQTRRLPVSPILQQRKEQLVKLLPHFDGAAASNIFADNFFPDRPLDSLKKMAAMLYQKTGKIRKVGELMPENQLRGRFIIEGEKSDIQVFFTLTPEPNPLIQKLNMREIQKPH